MNKNKDAGAMHVKFPQPFKHDHPEVRNVNELDSQRMTFAQSAADWVAATVGSWTFIIGQSFLLTIWVILNITAYIRHWDPYPFILMNLVLSLQAAYTAPIIMMSQNRSADRDRLEAQHDYEINKKAEVEVRAVLDHLAAQDLALQEIHRIITGGATAANAKQPG